MSKPTTVYVPMDSAAVAVGADQVAAAIRLAAIEHTSEVTVVRNGSRGLVWAEPMIEIEIGADRIAYGNVTPEDVPGLFASGFLEGRHHEKCLGPVAEIPYFADQKRITFRRCGLTDPLSIDDYQKNEGLAGLKRAVSLAPQSIVDELKASGLRGRGGAGFPAGIKWQTVLDTVAEQKYIVCNADEGDSGTFADRMIMEGDPFLIIEGMVIAAMAVGANRGYVYLRSEYPLTARIFGEALEKARSAGLLGNHPAYNQAPFDIELFIGAGAYICGEETSLLESLEGKRGQIRTKPPLPAIAGLFGQPTLVHNVISLCAVPDILAGGGDAYHAHGVERSRGTMPFQLAGNVKRGGLVELPFGCTLRDLVEGYGGGTASGRPIRAIQIGGPLGAYLPATMLDTVVEYETLLAIGAGVGHGGIVVFDDRVNLAHQARFAFHFCALESCGKCTPCRVGAVRGTEVMDKIIAGNDPERNLALVQDLCEVMVDGSLCAMGGMTPIPVQSAIEYFPEDFRTGAG